MATTLLIGNPRTSWREWLRDHRGHADLLCLDPADPVQLTPGVLNLFRGERPVVSRFYGSLDAQRHPHLLLAAATEMLAESGSDRIIETFAYRPTPVLRQSVILVAQICRPDRILVANGTDLDLNGFPTGPETVEVESALPPMVQHAQRKAQWLRLLERCERHTVDLRSVSVQGARLGSGRMLSPEERLRASVSEAVHVEVIGASLLIVCDTDLEENQVALALDFTGCRKAHFVEPGMYRNLICSFARDSGEDIGTGLITDVDWASMRAHALCTAVAPAPVRILKLGSMRVDSEGRELGELRPWQV